MRAFLFTLALGAAGAALYPAHEAQAWWDRWGRWHPNYGPGVVVAPAPRPYYYGPRYAHWVPPHYNRWGRFVPGHWI